MAASRKSRCSSLKFGCYAIPESLEPRTLLAAAPIISEFQAINRSTLLDEDGEASDWIEIQNPSSETIELAGWYLTDDVTELTKWRFPARQLEPDGKLLVFASSKNRTDAGELHTNFRLSGDGEFLALVQPDGVTVVQDYGDAFPPQREDHSFGLAQRRESTVLVDGDSAVSAFIPKDGSFGFDWTSLSFDAATWASGKGPVGFENLRPASTSSQGFDEPLSDDWTVDLPEEATGTVEVTGSSLQFSVPAAQDTTSFERGLAPIVHRELPIENATDWEFVAHIKKGTPGARGAVGIMIFDESTGKPALMLEQSVRRRFALVSGGTEFAWTQPQDGSFFLRLARNEVEKTWSALAKVENTDEWTLIATVTDGTFEGPVVAQPRLALFARTPVGTIDAQFESVDIIVHEQRPTYVPLIGLDVTEEMSGHNTSAFLRFPFQIAGDPSEFNVLNLGARFDDGFDAYLNGQLVSRNNSPILPSWNSPAAGIHGAVLGKIPLSQDDITDSIGFLREGDNVLAIHGMNVATNDLDFFFEGGLVASRVQSFEERDFAMPTPGSANVAPSAPSPLVVGDDGLFFGAKSIAFQLEDQAPDSLQIRYTLDGSEPTTTSELYTEPFTITESTVLQARTFDTLLAPNFQPSNITSKTYIALSEGLRERKSNMPLLVIDTLEQGIPGTNSNDLEMAGVVLLDVDPATASASLKNGVVDYLGRGGVRRRGSSTGAQAKPQLAFETWGPSGTDRDDDFDTRLLGLSSESDWVLHAPFGGDPTFMRNALGFELGNQMGRWAPKTRFAEVYINDNSGIVSQDHYAGVYVLIEKIKPGPGRLDIAEVNPEDNTEPDITGGYIWKVDRPDPDAPSFPAGGGSLNWVYPESPESITANVERKATPEQQMWVQNQFDAFARTLVNPDINDPEGYSKYIDVDAWIDYHLMQVVMYNADALGLSIFFHKDRDEKIAAGPLWDLNLSVESTRIDDDNPNLWLTGANFFGGAWWKDLVRDPGFWQRYTDRFQMWRETVLSDENLVGVLTELSDAIGDSADRNADRWPDNSYRSVSGFNSGYLDGTFSGEVTHMREWLFARMRFLEGLFVGAPQLFVDGNVVENVPGVAVFAGQEIEIVSAPILTPMDHQLVSGVPGTTIASYFVPSDDSLGNTWTEPSFDDSEWETGPTGIGFERRDNFAELIKTTVDPREVDGATNIFVRIPFQIEDLNLLDDRDMVLRMQFEDGYIAHLNGELVARDHVTSVDANWDSRGVNQSTQDALEFQEVDISRFKHLLVQGENVLAIRVLNSSPSSSEMLLVPELVLRSPAYERRANARVFYTTDGTDPRGPDGAPSPTATEAKPGSPLAINANTRIVARNLDDTDRGTEAAVVLTDWSAATQFDLVVTSSPVVISEVNYNPADPSIDEAANIPDLDGDGLIDWTNDDFEFVELHNPTGEAVDLTGVQFEDGIEFDFFSAGIHELAAGGYGVIVNNRQAFELRYGGDVPIFGEYAGNLNDGGELIELVDGTGETLFAVEYRDTDPWPVRSDGQGSTLVLANPSTPQSRQSKYYSWRPSVEVNGNPGGPGKLPIGIVINEVLASTDTPLSDSIELFNGTEADVDVGGWYLSDSQSVLKKFRIPDGTVLGAGQYLTFDESDFNADPNSVNAFALNSEGDDLWLTVVDAAGNVSEVVDDVHFRATRSDQSIGRVPDGSGRLAPLVDRSLGVVNATSLAPAVAISEVHYNPGPPSNEALQIDPSIDGSDLEFVELTNQSNQPVDLTGWQIRGGVTFDFPSTELSPSDSLVVVQFDPTSENNASRLLAFRAHYGINDDVFIVGGLRGGLSNSQDKILLLRAATSLVQEDEVVYDDQTPWSPDADGTGASLNRVELDSHGNDPSSWTALPPTPGSNVELNRGDFNNDGVVDADDIELLNAQIRLPTLDDTFDITSDGVVDHNDRDKLVVDILGTNYGDANLDGAFDSRDIVAVFSAGEYEDGISGNSTWAEGDWNGDGEFGTRDWVLAFMSGEYISPMAGSAALLAADVIAALAHDMADTVTDTDVENDGNEVEKCRRATPLSIGSGRARQL